MKKLYTILLVLLVAAAAAVGVVSLVDRDPTESKLENRKLAEMPEFTLAGLLDGSYFSQLETYYADTFPGRETLLQVNKKLNGFYHFSGTQEEKVLVIDFKGGMEQGGEALKDLSGEEEEPVSGPASETDSQPEELPLTPAEPETPSREEPPAQTEQPEEEVAYTSDGSLLIIGDRAMDIPTANNEVILDYAEAVNNLQAALGGDVRMISLLTPNAGQFYSFEDFHTGIHDQQAMIDLCYGAMADGILTVDAYSRLAAHTEEYIYFRTDHHWTALGAYYAYTAFCEAMGWEPVELDQYETGVYENFVGSMYKYTAEYAQSELLLNNPDTLTYYLPIVETHAKYYADADLENSVGYPVSVVYRGIKEEESNKYMCFLGGDHPAAVVECAVEGPTCLVLKESYGNAFIPFLTNHYSRIVVIDPREFNRDGMPSLDLAAFVEEQAIDDVIVINYPFMINNKYYVTWLNRLVGIDME